MALPSPRDPPTRQREKPFRFFSLGSFFPTRRGVLPPSWTTPRQWVPPCTPNRLRLACQILIFLSLVFLDLNGCGKNWLTANNKGTLSFPANSTRPPKEARRACRESSSDRANGARGAQWVMFRYQDMPGKVMQRKKAYIASWGILPGRRGQPAVFPAPLSLDQDRERGKSRAFPCPPFSHQETQQVLRL